MLSNFSYKFILGALNIDACFVGTGCTSLNTRN